MKKPQIITIAEIKGGTGKTTTAAALAQAAILEGKRVLCIDLDPQANLTALFDADPQEPGAYELLHGSEAAALIQETEFDIDVISGAPDLSTEKSKEGTATRLKNGIAPILANYDLIIIDTPPAFGEMTYNALQASTGLLVVVDTDPKAIQGMYHITDLARDAKQDNKQLKILGCIVANYDARPILHQKLREQIQDKAERIRCNYLGEIRQGVAIEEAQAYGKNLFEYSRKSKPAQDYKALYEKIIK